MRWEPEAEALLKRVPFFVRKKVKKKVEEFARERGEATVTKEVMLAAREALRDKASQAEKAFSVEGCFGLSSCPNAVTSSEELLNRLEKILEEKNLTSFLKQKIKGPLKHHHQFRVSLAECPNACSQVQIKDFALIGQAILGLSPENCNFCGECEVICEERAIKVSASGPEIDDEKCLNCGACARVCETGAIFVKEKGYRLLIGGKLGRHPQLAQEIKAFASEKEALEIFSKVLDFYQRHCKEGERLGAIIARLGFTQARKEILG